MFIFFILLECSSLNRELNSKRMCRLVSVRVFDLLGGGYIANGKEWNCVAACLFLALIVSVRDTKKFPS